MTSMPELVAMLHSFVGVAAVLVGLGGTLDPTAAHAGAEATIHQIEIFIGVFIGAITFTGSIIAFGKLRGLIGSKPLLLPARHLLNLGMLGACLFLGSQFLGADADARPAALDHGDRRRARRPPRHGHRRRRHAGRRLDAQQLLGLGRGGRRASCSSNDLLIITGALVGSSGAILSYIMCKAMNRSFFSVIFGGFGADEGRRRPGPTANRRARSTSVTAKRSRRPPARSPERRHRPGLRHGGGAGAAPALRDRRSSCAPRAPTCASRSTRSPAACPAT